MPSTNPSNVGGSAGAGAGGAGGTLLNAAIDLQCIYAGGPFVLVNATPTFVTVSLPADGIVHAMILIVRVVTTVTEVGGAIGFTIVDAVGTTQLNTFDAGAHGAGFTLGQVGMVAQSPVASGPSGSGGGPLITIQQASALTSGAATAYFGIFSS